MKTLEIYFKLLQLRFSNIFKWAKDFLKLKKKITICYRNEFRKTKVKRVIFLSHKSGMHNLFRIRGQKKKKDNVESQNSMLMLKHVVNLKILFFMVIYMNYIYYFILLMYRLCNKKIKQAQIVQ